jgi:CDP-diacylglycerol pyrophosphatase
MKPGRSGSEKRSRFAALLLGVALLGVAGCASAGPDVLWGIVTTCIDPGAPDYCSQCQAPRTETPCGQNRSCRDTTQVWAETPDFVAIRDHKMCDCPKEFVHGLAIPRARVTGVEDPKRPDGIWEFAWQQAASRIADDRAIALAVNPISRRSQNQLHVHIVRLRSDARQGIDQDHPTHVDNLKDVWSTAETSAQAAGLDDYGVLVAKDSNGGFLVVVDKGSPEGDFTEGRCTGSH